MEAKRFHMLISTNLAEANDSYVYLYDKRQAIALRMIANSLTYRSHLSPHSIAGCAKFLREQSVAVSIASSVLSRRRGNACALDQTW